MLQGYIAYIGQNISRASWHPRALSTALTFAQKTFTVMGNSTAQPVTLSNSHYVQPHQARRGVLHWNVLPRTKESAPVAEKIFNVNLIH